MAVRDILAMDLADIERLAKEDKPKLRKLTSQLRDVARKRVARLERAGIKTPSLGAFIRGNGLEKLGKRNITSILSQFGKLKRYLESGQSTVTEARAFQREVQERLGISELDEKQVGKFWKIWNKLKETSSMVFVPSKQMIEFMANTLIDRSDISTDELFDLANDYIRRTYENREWKDLGGGTSEFFN